MQEKLHSNALIAVALRLFRYLGAAEMNTTEETPLQSPSKYRP